jgi:hypothetical protein
VINSVAQPAVLTFRPHLALRVCLALALAWWVAVLAAALGLPEAPASTRWGALFFCGFFAATGLHYLSLEIQVDQEALTYRGLLTVKRLRLAEVRSVVVVPVPLMESYGVRAASGAIRFTSMIAGHRELAALVVERARLSPRRG